MRILFLWFLFVGMVGCGMKGEKQREELRPIGKEVVITDSLLLKGGADTLRLGRMGSGEQLVVPMYLTNRSAQPIVVVGHELTCGCIDLTYENKPIASGEFLPIEMHFDSRGLYGWQLKLFYLRFSGSDRPLKLYVEAEVE